MPLPNDQLQRLTLPQALAELKAALAAVDRLTEALTAAYARNYCPQCGEPLRDSKVQALAATLLAVNPFHTQE